MISVLIAQLTSEIIREKRADKRERREHEQKGDAEIWVRLQVTCHLCSR